MAIVRVKSFNTKSVKNKKPRISQVNKNKNVNVKKMPTRFSTTRVKPYSTKELRNIYNNSPRIKKQKDFFAFKKEVDFKMKKNLNLKAQKMIQTKLKKLLKGNINAGDLHKTTSWIINSVKKSQLVNFKEFNKIKKELKQLGTKDFTKKVFIDRQDEFTAEQKQNAIDALKNMKDPVKIMKLGIKITESDGDYYIQYRDDIIAYNEARKVGDEKLERLYGKKLSESYNAWMGDKEADTYSRFKDWDPDLDY